MSFAEKRIWTYLIALISVCGLYFYRVLNSAMVGDVSNLPYVSSMLTAIAITVGVHIIGIIVVSILAPKEADKEDERDKQIERFGESLGGAVLAGGILLPLGLAMAKVDHFWIAQSIFAAFVFSAIVSSIIKIVRYRWV